MSFYLSLPNKLKNSRYLQATLVRNFLKKNKRIG
jgi:hypothetical protein